MSAESEAWRWVEAHMPTECAHALAQFTSIAPRLRGIPWWDAMDLLRDSDSHLEVIEPMVEAIPGWTVLHHYIVLTLMYASASFATEMDIDKRVIAVLATIELNGGVAA